MKKKKKNHQNEAAPHLPPAPAPILFVGPEFLPYFSAVTAYSPLEKGMPTHSSMLAWRIPWTV